VADWLTSSWLEYDGNDIVGKGEMQMTGQSDEARRDVETCPASPMTAPAGLSVFINRDGWPALGGGKYRAWYGSLYVIDLQLTAFNQWRPIITLLLWPNAYGSDDAVAAAVNWPGVLYCNVLLKVIKYYYYSASIYFQCQ